MNHQFGVIILYVETEQFQVTFKHENSVISVTILESDKIEVNVKRVTRVRKIKMYIKFGVFCNNIDKNMSVQIKLNKV